MPLVLTSALPSISTASTIIGAGYVGLETTKAIDSWWIESNAKKGVRQVGRAIIEASIGIGVAKSTAWALSRPDPYRFEQLASQRNLSYQGFLNDRVSLTHAGRNRRR